MSPGTEPVNYIYPLNADAGYDFDNGEPVSVSVFYDYIVARGKTDWFIASNFRKVEAGDRIWAYFGGKDRMVCGVGYVWTQVQPSLGSNRHRIVIEWDQNLTADLRKNPIRYEEFRQWVAGPIARANAGTNRVLIRWLASRSRVAEAKAQKVKFAKQLVSHRLGQGLFRDAVLQRYNSTCVVSQCTVPEVLEAAHIDPVAKGGSHDVNNAVLLRCDIHNLFDMGILTIGKDGKIRVSKELRKTDYGRYHDKSIRAPEGAITKNVLTRLARHQMLNTLQ